MPLFRIVSCPSLGPLWDHTSCAIVNDLGFCARYARKRRGLRLAVTCGNVLPLLTGGQVGYWQLLNRVGTPEHVTRKSVVVYSTPMTQNGSDLPGSGRSRWTTNRPVAQQKKGNNRN